jgi:hypothetical protein
MKWLSLPALMLLAACSESPPAKDAEKAKAAVETNDSEIKEHKKSIEEAADAAAKLVEADAKAEIDALEPAEPDTVQ